MTATDRRTKAPAPQGLLRWAPVVGIGAMTLLLSRHAGEGISDPDTLWHILAGDHLRDTGRFVGPDPLSTFTTQPWILTQWLPELGMSLANQWGGLGAVAFLMQAARLAVCVALYVSCRRVAGPLAAAVVTALAVLGTASSLSPRPQLVGFLLLAVTTSAWLRTADDRRARWWLVVVAWLWACSHGTWVVGVMVGFATVAGMVIERRLDLRRALTLAAVPAACGVSALFTPLGLRLLETFDTVKAVSPYIQEWRRPDLTDASTIATATLFLLVGLAWARWTTLRRWPHALVLLVALGWALSYSRTVAVGAILVAPLAAMALERVLGRTRPSWGREPRLLAAMTALSVVVCAVLAATGPQHPVDVPDGLDTRLRALPADTVVWNDDTLGGWLMWSHPRLRQTADTRAEIYGPERARRYLQAVRAQPGWQAIIDRDDPRAALLPDGVPLVEALQGNRGWTVGGRDNGFVLLLRPAG